MGVRLLKIMCTTGGTGRVIYLGGRSSSNSEFKYYLFSFVFFYFPTEWCVTV